MAWTRDEMAARAAKELQDGYYCVINLDSHFLLCHSRGSTNRGSVAISRRC